MMSALQQRALLFLCAFVLIAASNGARSQNTQVAGGASDIRHVDASNHPFFQTPSDTENSLSLEDEASKIEVSDDELQAELKALERVNEDLAKMDFDADERLKKKISGMLDYITPIEREALRAISDWGRSYDDGLESGQSEAKLQAREFMSLNELEEKLQDIKALQKVGLLSGPRPQGDLVEQHGGAHQVHLTLNNLAGAMLLWSRTRSEGKEHSVYVGDMDLLALNSPEVLKNFFERNKEAHQAYMDHVESSQGEAIRKIINDVREKQKRLQVSSFARQ